MVKTKANELSTAFINAHQQDLVAIYKKSGEQGMQQAVNEGIAADLINYLKTDYLSKMKYTKQKKVLNCFLPPTISHSLG